jgi:hypothetical protein
LHENSFDIKKNALDNKTTIKVNHLMPIVLEFELPKSYPSVDMPKFRLLSQWLSLENVGKIFGFLLTESTNIHNQLTKLVNFC